MDPGAGESRSPRSRLDWLDEGRTTKDERPTTNDQRPTTNDQRPTTNDYFISTTTSSMVLFVSLTSLWVCPAGIGSCQYAFPVS